MHQTLIPSSKEENNVEDEEAAAKGQISPKDKDPSMNDSASTAVESIRVQLNLTPVTSAQPTMFVAYAVILNQRTIFQPLSTANMRQKSSAFYENWTAAVLEQKGLAKISILRRTIRNFEFCVIHTSLHERRGFRRV